MHLVADSIIDILTPALAQARLEPSVPPGTLADWGAALTMAQSAQTVIFPAELWVNLREALGKFDALRADDYRSPFACVCLQLDTPLPEHVFLSGALATGVDQALTVPADQDAIAAMLIHEHDAEEERRYNAAIWYTSGSVNRTRWTTAEPDPLQFVASAEAAALNADAMQDKRQIRRMALAALLFLSAENVTITRHTPAAPQVNARRRAAGKRELKPYYLCTIAKTAYDDADGSSPRPGGRHGHTYAVRGHFRRLQSGRVLWVRPHLRGLAHAGAGVVPKVYKVTEPPDPGRTAG